jgi:hypothetical protein
VQTKEHPLLAGRDPTPEDETQVNTVQGVGRIEGQPVEEDGNTKGYIGWP